MTRSDPPVAPDTDVRRFPGMILDCERLIDSTLTVITSGDEFKAAVLLWCKAWRQVPAGSLPNDERQLARWSSYDEHWPTIREGALHGFVLCSDDRFYHPVICQKALDVLARWNERSQHGRVAARKRWKNKKKLKDAQAMPEQCPSNANLMPIDAKRSKKESLLDRSEDSDASASDGETPSTSFDPIKDLWNRGLAILGEKRRSLLGKMVKSYGQVAVLAAIVETENETPADPPAFFIACCERRKSNGRHGNAAERHARDLGDFADWARQTDERESLRGADEAADRPLRAEELGGKAGSLL